MKPEQTDPRHVGFMLVEDGVLVCVWGKRFVIKKDQLVDLISRSGMQEEERL